MFEGTTDPILAGRLTISGEGIVVAGLIALAVGNQLVIAHPHGETAVSLGLLLFGGPLLYLTGYLWVVTRTPSYPRLGGLAALIVASGLSRYLPSFASLGLLAALLSILVVTVLHKERRASSRLIAHPQE